MTDLISVEVLYDEEVSNGTNATTKLERCFKQGEIIQVNAATAKSLLNARRVRKVKHAAPVEAAPVVEEVPGEPVIPKPPVALTPAQKSAKTRKTNAAKKAKG